MLIETIIQESLKIPDISERAAPDCRVLCFHQNSGEAQTHLFSLFPGITAAFTNSETASWPIPDAAREASDSRMLLLCYCMSGRAKICLNDRDAVSIGSGELVITGHFPEKEYLHPTNKYEGVTILVDLDGLSSRQDYLKKDFGIDLVTMARENFSRNPFYTVPAMHEYKETMKILWDLLSEESPYVFPRMRLCVLSILMTVMQLPSIPVSQGWAYLTASQIQIAENVHAILSADLSRRYSARELAARFGTSESSLKNYFKKVYGKSFAVYQRDARMKKSAELLKTTSLPVTEIAASVGYVSQSKFSDVFRNQFGVTPLEYRRLCAIQPDP